MKCPYCISKSVRSHADLKRHIEIFHPIQHFQEALKKAKKDAADCIKVLAELKQGL